MLQRILGFVFFVLAISVLYQCAQRGTPSGGPKDIAPPVLIKADPENYSIDFKETKIRLYFDELVKLKDVQEQLIVSPPLKYQPLLSPQGGAQKFVEIKIKDTLKENTTYTFNFGQSIVDNNEGNPNSFFTYVFSTGSYIDSLELQGVITDAFNKKADEFVSVMLYEIDSTYTDSTIYQRPPNYITNTLDSTVVFTLKNLKKGKYALFGLKDENKNNMFDQNSDKIGFIKDTIVLPTDSIFLLNLFKEIPDYAASVPSLAAKNKITFGYYGEGDSIDIKPLTQIPDTVKTIFQKEFEKDTINYWFTPYEMDSIVFTVTNEKLKVKDTFTIKNRKIDLDSLRITPNQSGTLSFNESFKLITNTPLISADTNNIQIFRKDSSLVSFKIDIDNIENAAVVDFELEPNETYNIDLFPGAITDFFGETNDTLSLRLNTASYADLGNLTFNINGSAVEYPLILQLTDEKGGLKREIYATESKPYEFTNLKPGNYLIRVIFDENENKKWDTGNYLKKIQPEKVNYYPQVIEVRANWELEQTFTITN